MNHDGLRCSLFHAAILDNFLLTDNPLLLVLKDDFVILDDAHFQDFLIDYEKIKNSPDWDIIVLTPHGVPIDGTQYMMQHHFYRIKNNQTMTGYIIKRSFVSILLNNVKKEFKKSKICD